MDEHHQSTVRGHQADSVSMKFVLNTGLGLALLVLISMLLTAGLLHILMQRTETVHIPAPTADSSALQMGSGLEPDKRLKLHEQRVAEEHVLRSYQWVDAKAGLARIPIRRAMQILAKEGLPTPTKETKE